MRFDSAPALERAAAAGEIGFGIDNTALVQEFLHARGRHITCVKGPGRKFLYAIKGLCREAPRETVMLRARKTLEDNRTRGTHTNWYLFVIFGWFY